MNLRAATIFVLLLAIPHVAFADRRVALVIGNGAYHHTPKLPNPTRDATAMAELFRKAGFEAVLARNDLGHLAFKRSLRDFLEAAQDADIAVLFYAGHGVQIGDQNYLLPVDAKLEREYDAKDETISLERVVEALDPAKRLRLVILDACRDNPFLATMQRRVASRGTLTRGLARVEPTQVDTLIAYAAKAGSSALDGDDGHSPFTKALLKYIAEPGLDVRLAFGRVRDDVLKSTRNEQEPFVYGSLGGSNISLVPAPAVPKEAPLVDVAADFNLVERINSKMAWEVFINTHKTGILVDVARKRLQVLEEQPPSTKPKLAALPPPREEPKATRAEIKAWNNVKDSGDVVAIRKFIEANRSSPLATAAREVLQELERAAQEKDAIERAQREEEARRAKADADRQKAKREAELAKAVREEGERKRIERQREAEAEHRRQAEVDREKAEREAALVKGAREKVEADRQKAEREATLAKAAEAEAERRRQAEAERQKAEREAGLAKAAREKADRKRQVEACAREEKTLARLKTSVHQASGREEFNRFDRALTCEQLRPSVVTLQAEVERLKVEQALAIQVRAAQVELRRIGCYSGRDDGLLRQATKDAIRRYLALTGRRPTTEVAVNENLVNQLKRAPPDSCDDSGPSQKSKLIARPQRREQEESQEHTKVQPAAPGTRVITGVGF